MYWTSWVFGLSDSFFHSHILNGKLSVSDFRVATKYDEKVYEFSEYPIAIMTVALHWKFQQAVFTSEGSNLHAYIFVHTFSLIGSRPSDHYFRSVCLSVCLCRVFVSRLWSDFDQIRTHVICLGLAVSPRLGGPLKTCIFRGLGAQKISRPTVLIGLSWFFAIL